MRMPQVSINVAAFGEFAKLAGELAWGYTHHPTHWCWNGPADFSGAAGFCAGQRTTVAAGSAFAMAVLRRFDAIGRFARAVGSRQINCNSLAHADCSARFWPSD